jgi:hypothetical protein
MIQPRAPTPPLKATRLFLLGILLPPILSEFGLTAMASNFNFIEQFPSLQYLCCTQPIAIEQ